ncbi:hypothetical protein DENSPDRAFT_834117 [Dentipellis sp. KUC8613]|nr:hypothetical protein DENSPDRAFT_834117 [Dentipellis sp. KUC8613]
MANSSCYHESSDAHVALMSAYMARYPQAGNIQVRPKPASHLSSRASKANQSRAPPPTDNAPVKSLGEGAFMKDVRFCKKADGTVIAVPKETGFGSTGRTIYEGKARQEWTRKEGRKAESRSKRDATRMDHRRPTPSHARNPVEQEKHWQAYSSDSRPCPSTIPAWFDAMATIGNVALTGPSFTEPSDHDEQLGFCAIEIEETLDQEMMNAEEIFATFIEAGRRC